MPREKDPGKLQKRGHRAGSGGKNQEVGQGPRLQARSDETLAGVAVERRQAGDRQGADQEQPEHRRQPSCQAAETLEAADVPLAGGADDRPDAQKQEALEQRVVDQVIQRSAQGRGGAGSEGGDDVAHLGHRVEGQEPLAVALGDGRNHAEHGGQAADPQQHLLQVPGTEQGHQAPQDEKRHLDHDPRQNGRHRVRGRSVGVGQPGVKGNEGGLDPGPDGQADHGQLEGPESGAPLGPACRLHGCGHQPEREGAGGLVEQKDPEQEEADTQGADQEVAETGHQGLAPFAAGDQDVGGDGQDLQKHEQVEQISGQDHALHAQHEEEKEEVETRGVFAFGHGKQEGARGHEQPHQGARPGQTVEVQGYAYRFAPTAYRVHQRLAGAQRGWGKGDEQGQTGRQGAESGDPAEARPVLRAPGNVYPQGSCDRAAQGDDQQEDDQLRHRSRPLAHRRPAGCPQGRHPPPCPRLAPRPSPGAGCPGSRSGGRCGPPG